MNLLHCTKCDHEFYGETDERCDWCKTSSKILSTEPSGLAKMIAAMRCSHCGCLTHSIGGSTDSCINCGK